MALVSTRGTVSRLRQPDILPYLICVFFHFDNTYGGRKKIIVPCYILKRNYSTNYKIGYTLFAAVLENFGLGTTKAVWICFS